MIDSNLPKWHVDQIAQAIYEAKDAVGPLHDPDYKSTGVRWEQLPAHEKGIYREVVVRLLELGVIQAGSVVMPPEGDTPAIRRRSPVQAAVSQSKARPTRELPVSS